MITCGSVISLQSLCIRKVAFSYCAWVFFFFFYQSSVYCGFGHGTQHTVLRTLYTVQSLPQFFTWSPLQQNYMVGE